MLSRIRLLSRAPWIGARCYGKVSATDFVKDPDPFDVLIDVRELSEQAGQIKGSISYPLSTLARDLLKGALNSHRQSKVLVYCRVGVRSELACKLLEARGFADVYNLEGGYDAYAKESS